MSDKSPALPAALLQAYKKDPGHLAFLKFNLYDVLVHFRKDLSKVISDQNRYVTLMNGVIAISNKMALNTIGDFATINPDDIIVRGFGSIKQFNLEAVMETIGGVFKSDLLRESLLEAQAKKGNKFFNGATDFIQDQYNKKNIDTARLPVYIDSEENVLLTTYVRNKNEALSEAEGEVSFRDDMTEEMMTNLEQYKKAFAELGYEVKTQIVITKKDNSDLTNG